MFSELNTESKTVVNRGGDRPVRLSPVPAQNTLLAILFFSAVAVAIGYWIFFPPAASQPSGTSEAPVATPAPAALMADS